MSPAYQPTPVACWAGQAIAAWCQGRPRTSRRAAGKPPCVQAACSPVAHGEGWADCAGCCCDADARYRDAWCQTLWCPEAVSRTLHVKLRGLPASVTARPHETPETRRLTDRGPGTAEAQGPRTIHYADGRDGQAQHCKELPLRPCNAPLLSAQLLRALPAPLRSTPAPCLLPPVFHTFCL